MTVSELTLVEPAFKSAPQYSQTLGPEVADLCGMVGFGPDPEQRLALDYIFALDKRGTSAAFEFAVICARQNLKTGLFKQAALGWLFITDQQLIVWSAHEFSTAQEAFRDMEILITNSPMLNKRVKQIYYGNGEESIELHSGQRLKFKARTKSGGRGLTGDKVVLDEGFALSPEHMGALLPTLSVRPDPQIVYGSSAGLSSSATLRAVRDRGRAASSPRLAYLEWCAERGGCESDGCTHDLDVAGCALDDVDNWHKGNPLLGRTRANGTGLSVEYVAGERQALPPLEFARERLGWWDEPGMAETFGHGAWESCFDEMPSGVEVGALAIATSMDLTRSAIVAAGVEDDITHVKPLQHGPGTGWVINRAKELQRIHGVDITIDGRGPGAMLIPHLERDGVKVRIASTKDVLDSCANMMTLVTSGQLKHGNYPELNAAVAGAVKRRVGDRWAWGRSASVEDITALEAATLAVGSVTDPDTKTKHPRIRVIGG